MSKINGERHPKGDAHGKPIIGEGHDGGSSNGCAFTAAGAIAALLVSIAARAPRPTQTPARARAASHP